MQQPSMALLLVLSGSLFLSGNAWGQSASRTAKVSPELEQVIGTGEIVSFIVRFRQGVDPASFQTQGPNRGPGRTAQIQALRQDADSIQPEAAAILQSGGATRLIQLWAINAIATTANANLIEQLRTLPEVLSITVDQPVEIPVLQSSGSTNPAEWNLEAIRAPEFWASGHTGTGIVVASMDTGVDYLHADLGSRWRDGNNSWFDPHNEYPTPFDNTGHGTSAISLSVGGDAGGSFIGVAPGAQWIAAKLFDTNGDATESDIHWSYQWLLDPDGNPATDDAPDVVNNSWGYLDSQNPCDLEFEADIATLKAAGMSVVFSAGNLGPAAGSSQGPANNPSGFSVGSVDIGLNVGPNSSRGPSACGQGPYPQLAAPGEFVRAADLTFNGLYPTLYREFCCTSAAAPHVAGALALLRGAHPSATVAELEQALLLSAADLGAAGVDYDTGAGLVDVVAASNFLANTAPIAASDNFRVFKNSSGNNFDVLANDTDVDGDPLTFIGALGKSTDQGGRVLVIESARLGYTPPANFVGTDTFEYDISDGYVTVSGSVSVTVGSAEGAIEEDSVLWTNAPTVTSPVTGSTLGATDVVFAWIANAESVDEWWLYAGSAEGSRDYYNSGNLRQATETRVRGLPRDGSPVHITLFHRELGRAWQSVAHRYASMSGPALIAPASGSTLSGERMTFSWAANDEPVDEWWLYAGTSPGSRHYADSGRLGSATSVAVDGLPLDGSPVHVTLYYRRSGARWQSVVYVFDGAVASP